MLQLEEEARGSSEELKELSEQLLEKVIPRLLRPLETGPIALEPCLIHGDLWYGNTATELDTGSRLLSMHPHFGDITNASPHYILCVYTVIADVLQTKLGR